MELQQITSLAGVIGEPGLGTHQKHTAFTLIDEAQILDSNPGRVWALITNDSDKDVVYALASLGSGVGLTHTIRPWGHLLLNAGLPWSGAVNADCADVMAGAERLTVTECVLVGKQV